MTFSPRMTRCALATAIALLSLSACTSTPSSTATNADVAAAVPTRQLSANAIYGTQEPFAKESVYFVMTDRYVDGDRSNNQPQQGAEKGQAFRTFNRPLKGPDGQRANVGYMGGDLQGILNHVNDIKAMGFTALWLTPIVDNPDEAFTGGEPIEFGGSFKDGGKTAYHGYWGSNFFKEDEHLVSANLNFKTFTQKMHDAGLKVVLDIVANHGSPAFTMPEDQPKFGQIFDQDDKLIADHSNLPPEQLDANNPLHAFYHQTPDLLQLSNNNDESPLVRDYFFNAYNYWISQGADAFRIDTIRHMPHPFWKEFADRIRAEHPNFYMFGESFEYDANKIAQHTLPENGAISVLDFPMQKAMQEVFGSQQKGYERIAEALHLTNGPYHNVYELTTFYDNHDMTRIDANENGFIDANNWLFTARGIPVVYYGSEMGFMAGKKEHEGNRNYYGADNVRKAKASPIHKAMSAIANVRKTHIALQQGIQVQLTLQNDQASFLRVYQDGKTNQTALVLLNKGDAPATFHTDNLLSAGKWRDALTGKTYTVDASHSLTHTVDGHSVAVFVFDGINNNAKLYRLLGV